MTFIDVHSHFISQTYLDALHTSGIQNVDGYPLPSWTAESHLAGMDQNQIQTSILSISSPGLRFAGKDEAVALARRINEEARELIEAYPSRFGAFALLPLPDVESALSEIAYALDVLKLDGIGLYSNYGGAYLGEPQFAPILDELNRRQAVVFVHPTAPPGFDQLSLGYPAPMIEYPFESTRMVVSLLGSDTLTRCPDIRLIVPHGGGTIPYLAPRIAAFVAIKSGKKLPEAMEENLSLLRSLFYDLTASTHLGALSAIHALLPPSQLLAGFDYPFMPTQSIAPAIRDLASFREFTEADRRRIDTDNARTLFPRLGS